MSRFVLPACALFLTALASCAIDPPGRPQAHITFGQEAILVPASSLKIDDEYQPTLMLPNIEQMHKQKPVQIPQNWIQARVKTIPDAPGTLTLTVSNAGATIRTLTVKTDWRHMFDRQPDREMTAVLVWKITYASPSLKWSSEGTAKSIHQILEQASLDEVDEEYNAMLEALAKEFDRRVTAQIGELRKALASPGPTTN